MDRRRQRRLRCITEVKNLAKTTTNTIPCQAKTPKNNSINNRRNSNSSNTNSMVSPTGFQRPPVQRRNCDAPNRSSVKTCATNSTSCTVLVRRRRSSSCSRYSSISTVTPPSLNSSSKPPTTLTDRRKTAACCTEPVASEPDRRA